MSTVVSTSATKPAGGATLKVSDKDFLEVSTIAASALSFKLPGPLRTFGSFLSSSYRLSAAAFVDINSKTSSLILPSEASLVSL